MKFLEAIKKFFTRNIPLKLLALVLAALCVIVIAAATHTEQQPPEETAAVERA